MSTTISIAEIPVPRFRHYLRQTGKHASVESATYGLAHVLSTPTAHLFPGGTVEVGLAGDLQGVNGRESGRGSTLKRTAVLPGREAVDLQGVLPGGRRLGRVLPGQDESALQPGERLVRVGGQEEAGGQPVPLLSRLAEDGRHLRAEPVARRSADPAPGDQEPQR